MSSFLTNDKSWDRDFPHLCAETVACAARLVAVNTVALIHSHEYKIYFRKTDVYINAVRLQFAA